MRIWLSDFLPEGVVVSAEDAALLMEAGRALDAEDDIYQQDANTDVSERERGDIQEW